MDLEKDATYVETEQESKAEGNEKIANDESASESKPIATKRGSRGPRPFPQNSIKEAMEVAESIKEHNAGNPWGTEQLAHSLKVSATTAKYFYLTASSRDYGLTVGTSKGKTIQLTPLGRKTVFPENSQQRLESLKTAFLNIDIFRKVFEYYTQGELPEKEYVFNTLQETFDLAPTYHEEFYKVYTENLEFLKSIGLFTGLNALPMTDSPSAFGNGLMQTPQTSNELGRDLFVIMPFSERTEKYPEGFFEEVYNSLIVPAATQAKFNAKTAQKSGSDIIHKTIVNSIYNAEIILADLTEHNPNVLFELGLAIAFKKKVAIIRAKGTMPIFDVDNSMRVLDYNSNLWPSTVEMDIERLANHLETASTSDDSMYLDIFLNR